MILKNYKNPIKTDVSHSTSRVLERCTKILLNINLRNRTINVKYDED